MKKLFEKGRQGKAEPDVELILAEIGGIVRLLLSGGRFVVFQEYRDIVQDMEAFPKLLFR